MGIHSAPTQMGRTHSRTQTSSPARRRSKGMTFLAPTKRRSCERSSLSEEMKWMEAISRHCGEAVHIRVRWQRVWVKQHISQLCAKQTVSAIQNVSAISHV